MIDYSSEYFKVMTLLSEKINLLRNKNILISGATGLIGSYLTNFLLYENKENNSGNNIYVITRSRDRSKKIFHTQKRLHIIEHDMTETFESDRQFDYIVHAASNAHPLAFSLDPVGTMKVNLIGTMNLLDLAKKCDSKLIYLSSGEVYGNQSNYAFSEEDFGLVDSKKVRSCYPESKRAAETLCAAYHHQFNVKTNVARLCYVYGPSITEENSRADAQFLRNALNREDIVLKSQGLQKRTYCYVADAVSAILYILLNDFEGEFFNVANPNSVVSIREYAETLCKVAGVNLKFETPSEIEKRGYSAQADSILDASKLIRMGWQPFFSLEEGLRSTLEKAITNV